MCVHGNGGTCVSHWCMIKFWTTHTILIYRLIKQIWTIIRFGQIFMKHTLCTTQLITVLAVSVILHKDNPFYLIKPDLTCFSAECLHRIPWFDNSVSMLWKQCCCIAHIVPGNTFLIVFISFNQTVFGTLGNKILATASQA